ncbi:hypothetical protein KUCAC02_034897 [Chaenocephalus aceratus]|nr:hypothetical protein KUCAC02_034897 [Chaenocephalus aceratus]
MAAKRNPQSRKLTSGWLSGDAFLIFRYAFIASVCQSQVRIAAMEPLGKPGSSQRPRDELWFGRDTQNNPRRVEGFLQPGVLLQRIRREDASGNRRADWSNSES